MELPCPFALIRFYDAQLCDEATAVKPANGPLMAAIADNHRCNRLLWQTEDQARRRDVPADTIVRCKRNIDRDNQQRNDAVERIDEALLLQLIGATRRPDARQHSETAGAIIDRLSILSLKIFHMRQQTERPDADAAHLSGCSAKLQCLHAQRNDLCDCLAQLFNDIRHGDAYFKPYRQFKMYNDPRLNPWLTAGVQTLPPGASAIVPPQ